jgi:epsin
MNLLDFDDTEPAPAAGSTPTSAAAATNKALPALAPLSTNENGVSLTISSLYVRSAHKYAIAGGDDDFTDFQAAPSSPPAAAPVAGTAKPNLMDLLASAAPSASRSIQSAQPKPFGTLNSALAAAQLRPSSTPATTPGFTGMPVMNPMSVRSTVTSPVNSSTTTSASASASTKTGSAGGGFDDLWSMSLGSVAAGKSVGGAGTKSIRDLEKEKAQAGIWGAQSQMRPQAAAAGAFGSFVKPVAPSSAGDSAGADDLLL